MPLVLDTGPCSPPSMQPTPITLDARGYWARPTRTSSYRPSYSPSSTTGVTSASASTPGLRSSTTCSPAPTGWSPRPPPISRAAGELQTQYHDQSLGVVDAGVLALLERLGEDKLATLDHRHFALLRPSHVEALQLLP